MQIVCNGEKKDIETDTRLTQFMADLGVEPDTVFVECNGVILKKEDYETFVLPEGAVLELIRFVGGG